MATATTIDERPAPVRLAADDGLPPGPSLPVPVQMLLWVFAFERYSRYCQRRYGDTFTLRLPINGRVVQVCDPEGVRQVFAAPPADARAGEANIVLEPLLGSQSVLLLDGPEHLRQRKLMLPAFHGDRMQGFGAVIEEITRRELRGWREGDTIALRDAMQRITLEVILRVVFGADEGAELATLRDRLITVLDTASPLGLLPGLRHDLGPRSPWGRFLRGRAAVDETVYALIRDRRGEVERGAGAARADVLHTLLLARDEDGRPMSDRELRDELMTLLLAGHETTATAMTWFFDLMLRSPSAMARLQGELDGDGPGEWLDACIRETLRIRPVVPAVARRLHAPLEVMGHRLPAGVAVATNILATQRSATAYEDPLEFRPERFLGVRPDPNAWLPFGGGIRRCLGASFATFEMRTVIPTVLRHATLRPVGARGEGIRRRAVTLVPRRGGKVVVEELRPG